MVAQAKATLENPRLTGEADLRDEATAAAPGGGGSGGGEQATPPSHGFDMGQVGSVAQRRVVCSFISKPLTDLVVFYHGLCVALPVLLKPHLLVSGSASGGAGVVGGLPRPVRVRGAPAAARLGAACRGACGCWSGCAIACAHSKRCAAGVKR